VSNTIDVPLKKPFPSFCHRERARCPVGQFRNREIADRLRVDHALDEN